MTDPRHEGREPGYIGDANGGRPGSGHGEKRRVYPIVKVLLACCVVLLLLDLVIHREVHHLWENLFGFYALYGFVACVLLVLAATQMRKVLMRPEDHYDAD